MAQNSNEVMDAYGLAASISMPLLSPSHSVPQIFASSGFNENVETIADDFDSPAGTARLAGNQSPRVIPHQNSAPELHLPSPHLQSTPPLASSSSINQAALAPAANKSLFSKKDESESPQNTPLSKTSGIENSSSKVHFN